MLKKRLLVTFSILILIAAIFQVAAMGDWELQETAGNELKEKGIYQGYTDGTLRLENNLKRAEFATLMVRILDKESLVELMKASTFFNDVDGEYWAAGYINIVDGLKLFKGYEDGSFRPENTITYAETVTLLIRMLGEDYSPEGNNWPNNYLEKANALGITQNMNRKPNHVVTRGEIAVLITNYLRLSRLIEIENMHVDLEIEF